MRFPDLKVGDKVMRPYEFTIIDGGWGTGLSQTVVAEETVARVTATQGITESGLRFTRERGSVVADKGFVYPVGWVTTEYGRPDREMVITPAKEIEALTVLANEVRRHKTAWFNIDRNQGNILKSFLRGKPTVLAALELQEITDKLVDLGKGWKP